MYFSRYHILLLLLATPMLMAQPGESSREDSIRTYHTPEVIVRGESILPRIAGSVQPLSIITRGQIEGMHARDASDALALAPGVFVRQYGGLGGLRTVSLRGTSAQQSVLLIDGVRYQNSANGGFDLSNIPADAVGGIEVIRGGNAALFGANALGGVINLTTRSSAEHPFLAELRAGIGSFGERQITGAVSGGDRGQAWDASIVSSVAGGDYPFSFNEFGATSTVHRENADFSNLFGRGAWSSDLSDDVRLGASMQGFLSERGVPGAVVQGSREQTRARMKERDLFGVTRLALVRSAWDVSLALSGRLNYLRYSDPDARITGPEGLDNEYDRSEASATARARAFIGETGVIDLSTELAWTRLEGDNLDPRVSAGIARTQIGGAVATSWAFNEIISGVDLGVEASLRGDWFSDLEAAVSPALGIIIHPGGSPLRLRAHGALSYRVPSFTEQYYLNYGNIDLRPERSRSLDLGLTYEAGEHLVIEATGFIIDTRDQIVSQPQSPVIWSAANVGRVLSRGLELSANGVLFDDLLSLHGSYTLMRVEDRSGGEEHGRLVVYAPQELIAGLADLHLDRYLVGASWQYVSHRFTLPLNPPESALPGYGIVGLHASARYAVGAIDASVRVEVSNLLDAPYQVIRNYPMPGRMLRLGVSVKYMGDR